MECLVTKYTIKPTKISAVKKAIKIYTAATKSTEPTVMICSVCQHGQPNEFIHFLVITNDAAEDKHFRSRHFKELTKILDSSCAVAPEWMEIKDWKFSGIGSLTLLAQ